MVKRILLYILPFFMLVGCGRHSVDSRLAQVNELANRNETDSAMAVLSSIEKQSLNEHNRHYYDLMSIKTRDKAYQDITGETVITDIIDYFDGNGNDYVKGEAYYYGGRVYREKGDAPQALDYFQKALDAFPEDEAMMKGKTASQMGQIFLNMYMFEHAKPKFQEAIRYQKDCKDSVGQILDLRVLGDVYQELNIVDSALWCFKRALNLNSKSDSNLKREIDIRSSIIDLYVSQGDYDKARQEFVEFDTLSNGFKYDYVLYTRINMYIINKNYDKAIDLAHKLKHSQSLRSRIFAYSILLDYSRNSSNLLYDYAIEHKKCVDTLNLQASTNAIINQNSLYNYTIKEKDKAKLEKLYLNSTIFYLSAILCLTFVIGFVIYVYRMVRKQNRILFIKNNKLKTFNNALISDNEKMKISLSEQFDKIKNLENHINKIEDTNAEYNLTEEIQEQIINRIRNIDLDSYQINCAILESEVYASIRNAIQNRKGITETKTWQQLDDIVNIVYPNFRVKLYYLNSKLNELDYQICLLIKCRFSINEISLLTFKGKNAIINRRTRLYFKLFGIKGSAIDLDRYLLSL